MIIFSLQRTVWKKKIFIVLWAAKMAYRGWRWIFRIKLNQLNLQSHTLVVVPTVALGQTDWHTWQSYHAMKPLRLAPNTQMQIHQDYRYRLQGGWSVLPKDTTANLILGNWESNCQPSILWIEYLHLEAVEEMWLVSVFIASSCNVALLVYRCLWLSVEMKLHRQHQSVTDVSWMIRIRPSMLM